MSDLVFTAPTVDDAVTLAADTLGLPRAGVRYIVLQPEVVAVGRTPPQPARIVVLVEQQRSAVNGPRLGPGTLEATLTTLSSALSTAAEVQTSLTLSETQDGVSITLGSSGGAAPWESEPEVLAALDLLLRRIASLDGQGRRIRIEIQGQSDRRETALRQAALSVADAVLADGETRELEHLNAFERRIVHMVLAGVSGIRTRSEGVGAARRLLVETTPTRDN